MRQNPPNSYSKLVADAWATASVHIDALIAEPRAYLTAAKWWVLRKRVRARGQFAPLLSRSPRAYTLWVLRQDRGGQLDAKSMREATNVIIALVDTRLGPKEVLGMTLESLCAERISYLLIGTPQIPDLHAAINKIDWVESRWFLPILPGETVQYGTKYFYSSEIDKSKSKIIYADDDLLIEGRRTNPYFKPDWNAELFRYSDYISGSCILNLERSDIEAISDCADWIPRLTADVAKDGCPQHLRQMLHHRSERPTPRVPAVPLKPEHDLPSVSVIVPTRNRVDLLRTCLDGIMATDYPEIEVIVMDNDSDDSETLSYLAGLDSVRYRVLRHEGAFNYSAINNRAVAEARGRLICLLNNDIEVIEPRWLVTLADQALRPEVGAVGSRLLYPDGRIQHAGVVVGVGNAAGHAHRFLYPEEEGYFHRHSLPQFTMAVTAACLVVERNKFLSVGGLDEFNFPVAFNDVDLCLRLNQRGWQSLYEPRATLIHHESVSRGLDKDPVGAARFSKELAALKRIWKTDEIFDPYHHPQLSRASEQFAVAL